MKNILILIFLLVSIHINSQIISKRAVYKIKYINTENNKFLIAAANQEANLDFFLDFNNLESQFYIERGMALPDEKLNLAIILSNAQNTLFTSLKTKKITSQSRASRMVDEKEFIITEDVPTNWQILNETKLIDGLKCFKATRLSKTPNSNPKFKKEYIQIAWFCPEIPYIFGPTYSSGLPGLVVEFQDNNNFFYLKKIMDLKQKFKFKQPKKGAIITTADLNDTIASRVKRRKKVIEKYNEQQEKIKKSELNQKIK